MYTSDCERIDPIVVYTKPQCPMCVATKRQLDKLGAYWVEGIISDDILDFATNNHINSAPVVVYGSQCHGGFRPDALVGYAAQQREDIIDGLRYVSHYEGVAGDINLEANGLTAGRDAADAQEQVINIDDATSNDEGLEIVICRGAWMYATGISRCGDVLYFSADHDEPVMVDLDNYALKPDALLSVNVLGLTIPLNVVNQVGA